MALVLVYYKTIQIYFCSCGEQVPEYHKFIQDDTASRPNYKEMNYECSHCTAIVKIKLEFISSSSYVPPPPPPPPPAFLPDYCVAGGIGLCGYIEDQREINNNDTMVGAVGRINTAHGVNKYVGEELFDPTFINNDIIITGAPPIAP